MGNFEHRSQENYPQYRENYSHPKTGLQDITAFIVALSMLLGSLGICRGANELDKMEDWQQMQVLHSVQNPAPYFQPVGLPPKNTSQPLHGYQQPLHSEQASAPTSK